AKQADDNEVTRVGVVVGSAPYMSPEQARGESSTADRRADIYSTGVMMYEMLTGELPFRGDKFMLLHQIQLDPPPRLKALNHRVPADLENICLKCLEKDPRHRYGTAEEFAEDCRRFLEGRDVRARPVPPIVQSYRWCRRNPALASLLTAVGVLLAAVAIVSAVSQQRTQKLLQLSQSSKRTIEKNLYYSEMTRAGLAASTAEGMSEVSRLVANWEPAGDSDLRGWEWYYLKSLLHQDRATFRQRGEVTSLDISPDGSLIAAGSAMGDVTIWTFDGQLKNVLDAHSFTKDVDWSPSGSHLAMGNSEGQVRIWNASTQSETDVLDHSGSIRQIEWCGTDDGRLLVTNTSADASKAAVTVWDTGTQTKVVQDELATERLSRFAWSPDGKHIALAPANGPLDILNRPDDASGKGIGDASLQVFSMLWSPASDRLAVSNRTSASVQLWSLASLMMEHEIPSKSLVSVMAWEDSGALFAYSDGNKEVQLWDLTRHPATPLKTLRGHLDRATAICFHPRRQLIVTGSIDGEIKVWNIEPSAQLKRGAAFVEWRPNDDGWATSLGKALQVGDYSGGVDSVMEEQKEFLIDAAWSPDGAKVASIDYYGIIRVWNLAPKECICEFDAAVPPTGTRLPAVLDWHPRKPWLAFPDGDKAACVLNVVTGQVEMKFAAKYSRINCLAWSPTGNLLAVGSRDRKIRVWDVKTNRIVNEFGNTGNKEISSIDWSPDGVKLVAAASSTGVIIYDLANPEYERQLLGHNDYVHSVDWSPDGARIASGDQSGFVRIWDATSGHQTLVLQHPKGPVPHVAWHPNGRSLAAATFGGPDGIQVWNAPSYRYKAAGSSFDKSLLSPEAD
ncbi:MAG: protein kinase, partial [Planctomycetota bacterium]